jgi:hypothetical protein
MRTSILAASIAAWFKYDAGFIYCLLPQIREETANITTSTSREDVVNADNDG